MAALYANKLSNSYHVRSSSLPARLHPSAKKIEEELQKLRSLELSSSSNSKTLMTSLSGLTELYRCIVEVFNMPAAQQALAQQQVKNSMDQLLDVSLRYLDACSGTRDATLRIKESVRELQSALRRKKGGDLSIEGYITAYISSRKWIKKEISKSLVLLKEMDTTLGGSSSSLDGLNYQLSSLVKLLREASLVSGVVFRSLLSFLSTPVLKPKPTRWASVLKLMKKEREGHQQENSNELEVMETELTKLLMQKEIKTDRIQYVIAKLEAADITIEDLENSLECLFRRMIQARVSLLNIISI